MRKQPQNGICLKNIAQVRNPRMAQALRADIDKRGIKVITGTEVTGFETHQGRVNNLLTSQGKFSADQFAVCTGAWTGQLLEPLGLQIAIEPVQGQMILFKTEPGDIARIVLETDRYIIPRRDGRVLFGSTVEQVKFAKHTTAAAKKELHEIAVERFPILKDKPIEHHWAGLRPGSPDGVPFIGQHPEISNLYVNAGHFRNGVVLAPASCQLMTEIMLEQATSFDPADYALIR